MYVCTTRRARPGLAMGLPALFLQRVVRLHTSAARPPRRVRIWQSGTSTRADSDFREVNFPRTEGSLRLSRPGDWCDALALAQPRSKKGAVLCALAPPPKQKQTI